MVYFIVLGISPSVVFLSQCSNKFSAKSISQGTNSLAQVMFSRGLRRNAFVNQTLRHRFEHTSLWKQSQGLTSLLRKSPDCNMIEYHGLQSIGLATRWCQNMPYKHCQRRSLLGCSVVFLMNGLTCTCSWSLSFNRYETCLWLVKSYSWMLEPLASTKYQQMCLHFKNCETRYQAFVDEGDN